MASSLKEVMIRKSDDGLLDYIDNFNKYTPEAITEAVNELKRRGKKFTGEEINDINEKIKKRTTEENGEEGLWDVNSERTNIVLDPNAPLLYSKGAIRGFCLVFSVIFGAVLLSYNINDKKKKWIVTGFGIIYAVTILIVNIIPQNGVWLLLLNTAGGLGLTTTFWDKYVGKEIKYRAKPIWKPLIISLIITIPFLLAIIYS